MKKKILTIAIPTFNRINSLKLTLTWLIPQLTEECELLILDNRSNDGTKDLLESVVTQNCTSKVINVIRNACNVGGNENILRCIEYSSGDYVWLLGDDDTPLPNAVDTILMNIKNHPKTLVFNYYLECPAHQIRHHSHKTYGSVDYLSYTNFLGELVFISNIVLSVKQALQNLNEAHLWQSSHVPQLIVTTMMLRGGGEAFYSANSLVKRQFMLKTESVHGSILPVAAGIGSLSNARWTFEEVEIIVKLELWFDAFTVINQLVILASKGTNQIKEANIYRKNILRSLRLKPFNKFQRALLFASYLLIKYPNLSIHIRNLVYRYVKKNDEKNLINLDFNR